MNGDMNSIYEKLGGLEAKMSEVKHGLNNNTQKVDILGDKILTVVATVEGMADHDNRINQLEVDKHRREGAIGLVEWFGKHWPFTLVSSLIIAAVMWANGKLGF